MNYINNITEAIGHTPLLKLNRVGKDAGANVFVKLEHLNPSGSYKDRMALAMVEAAERGDTWNGKKLDEGGTVVEASAGNTAPAVAMVCAAKGYKAKIFLYRYQLEGGKNTRMLITQAYGPQVGISSEPDVYLTPEQIEEPAAFVSIDVSFISLTKVLPPVRELMTEDGEIVCLIKPQFEAGREKVGKKGVVRDPKVHEEVIEKVIDFAATVGLESRELEFSPIKGPEGNIEYLLHLLKRPDAASVEPFAGNVQEIVAQAHGTLDK